MKRKKSGTVITILSVLSVILAALVLVLLLTKGGAYYDLKVESDDKDQRITELDAENQQLNLEIDSKNTDIQNLTEEKEQLEKELKIAQEANEIQTVQTGELEMPEMSQEVISSIESLSPGQIVDSSWYDTDTGVVKDQWFLMYDLSKDENVSVLDKITKRIQGKTYNEVHNEIEIKDLSYLVFLYYDTENNARVGEMLVNTEIAEDMIDGLHRLFKDSKWLVSAELPERFLGLAQQTGNDQSNLSQQLSEVSRNVHNSYGFNVEYTRDSENEVENWSLHCSGKAVYLYCENDIKPEVYFQRLESVPRNGGGFDLYLGEAESPVVSTTEEAPENLSDTEAEQMPEEFSEEVTGEENNITVEQTETEEDPTEETETGEGTQTLN